MTFENGFRRNIAAIHKSTYTGALRLLAVGGVLLAINSSSFALEMSNPCGVRGDDNYMAYDYCMGNSSNPVTDQIPDLGPGWPGDPPIRERHYLCVVCGEQILWRHIDGTVHYWQIRKSQREAGFDVGATGPVGPDWRLIGAGDLDGDGTDDLLWQHSDGTVHYWPMKNGQPQGEINIGSRPVGPEWRLIGAGDLNGDGTDDILWQHVDGTVHYWRIKNGQPQSGINIGATGPVGSEWKLIGVGNLKGTGDLGGD